MNVTIHVAFMTTTYLEIISNGGRWNAAWSIISIFDRKWEYLSIVLTYEHNVSKSLGMRLEKNRSIMGTI